MRGACPRFATEMVTCGLVTPTNVGSKVTLLVLTQTTGTAPFPCNGKNVGIEEFEVMVSTAGYDCT